MFFQQLPNSLNFYPVVLSRTIISSSGNKPQPLLLMIFVRRDSKWEPNFCFIVAAYGHMKKVICVFQFSLTEVINTKQE